MSEKYYVDTNPVFSNAQDLSNFVNLQYALDLGIFEYLYSYFFPNATNKIIYASNAYAFRKRMEGKEGVLEFPFINFRKRNAEVNPQKGHFILDTFGVYVPELEEKLRMVGVTVHYEATFWCRENYDREVVIHQLLFNDNNKVYSNITIDGTSQVLYGFLKHTNITENPQYAESDWLVQNNIQSISMDFDVETHYLKLNNWHDITITNSVLLNFYRNTTGDFDSTLGEHDLYQFAVDHVHEEVNPS